MPPELIFPDTEVGNEGLCRLVASLDVMPDDVPTTEQNLQQANGLLPDYGPNYTYVYDRLGNFTAPTLVVQGTQVGQVHWHNLISCCQRGCHVPQNLANHLLPQILGTLGPGRHPGEDTLVLSESNPLTCSSSHDNF